MKTIQQYIDKKGIKLNSNEVSYYHGYADALVSIHSIKTESLYPKTDYRYGIYTQYPVEILQEIFEKVQ